MLFRDTAHGLLAWALATVIVTALFTLGTLGTSAAVVATEGPPAADAPKAAAALTEGSESGRQLLDYHRDLASSRAFIGAVAGGLGGYHRDTD